MRIALRAGLMVCMLEVAMWLRCHGYGWCGSLGQALPPACVHACVQVRHLSCECVFVCVLVLCRLLGAADSVSAVSCWGQVVGVLLVGPWEVERRLSGEAADSARTSYALDV